MNKVIDLLLSTCGLIVFAQSAQSRSSAFACLTEVPRDDSMERAMCINQTVIQLHIFAQNLREYWCIGRILGFPMVAVSNELRRVVILYDTFTYMLSGIFSLLNIPIPSTGLRLQSSDACQELAFATFGPQNRKRMQCHWLKTTDGNDTICYAPPRVNIRHGIHGDVCSPRPDNLATYTNDSRNSTVLRDVTSSALSIVASRPSFDYSAISRIHYFSRKSQVLSVCMFMFETKD
jgi:hypothetical protein